MICGWFAGRPGLDRVLLTCDNLAPILPKGRIGKGYPILPKGKDRGRIGPRVLGPFFQSSKNGPKLSDMIKNTWKYIFQI